MCSVHMPVSSTSYYYREHEIPAVLTELLEYSNETTGVVAQLYIHMVLAVTDRERRAKMMLLILSPESRHCQTHYDRLAAGMYDIQGRFPVTTYC